MMKSCFGGLNILMMLYPVLCLEDNSTCKIGNPQKCSHVTGSFRSSEYNAVISSGSCQFDFDFCNYTQRCKGHASLPWENVNGSAEMQGQFGPVDSYSVLGSPVIYIPCNSNLIINVTIANPSQLEIALIKNNASCLLMEQTVVGQVENLYESLLIEGPAYIEILFRGKNGGGSPLFQSYVRLHSVHLTTARNCTDPNSLYTTHRIESSTVNVPNEHSTTESESNTITKYLTQENETNNVNVGVIVGPIMAGLAIVTIVLVVWTWKCRRETCHGIFVCTNYPAHHEECSRNFVYYQDQTQSSVFAVLALEQNSQESTYNNCIDKFLKMLESHTNDLVENSRQCSLKQNKKERA